MNGRPPAPSPVAQSPAEPDTRERLVRAAAELLWERSYQAASVDDLCARAKARKGSFYHYFASKTDLAVASVHASWVHTRDTVFEPIFRDGRGGMAQLRKLIEAVNGVQTEAIARRGAFLGCPFGSLGQEMAHQDERLRRAVQDVFDGHCAYIRGALERAQQIGEIPPGDNHKRARRVFAFLEGALLIAKVANDASLFLEIASSIPSVASG